MTINESLKNRIVENDEWVTKDLIKLISSDTGYTYESCRCNTFRHIENLPDWFFNNYKYISNGTGKPSRIIKEKFDKIISFNKDFIYEWLFNKLNKNSKILTFCGYCGNDVKWLIDNNYIDITCVDKNRKILNTYEELKYKSKNICVKYNKINLDFDIVFYDSCSYFCKNIEKDLILTNISKINNFFITVQNINNKYCNNNLIKYITDSMYNFNLIDIKTYTSRIQKMIVFKFENKIFTQHTR